MSDEKCPNCGAPTPIPCSKCHEVHPRVVVEYDGAMVTVGDYSIRAETQAMLAARAGLWMDEALCLRRQLAQAKAENEDHIKHEAAVEAENERLWTTLHRLKIACAEVVTVLQAAEAAEEKTSG